MNSHVLTARLSKFAVAAIYLARVIQTVWLLFNQMTVNRDENRILAVFEFHGQIRHSSIKVAKIVERTRILAYFSLSQTVGKLI